MNQIEEENKKRILIQQLEKTKKEEYRKFLKFQIEEKRLKQEETKKLKNIEDMKYDNDIFRNRRKNSELSPNNKNYKPDKIDNNELNTIKEVKDNNIKKKDNNNNNINHKDPKDYLESNEINSLRHIEYEKEINNSYSNPEINKKLETETKFLIHNEENASNLSDYERYTSNYPMLNKKPKVEIYNDNLKDEFVLRFFSEQTKLLMEYKSFIDQLNKQKSQAKEEMIKLNFYLSQEEDLINQNEMKLKKLKELIKKMKNNKNNNDSLDDESIINMHNIENKIDSKIEELKLDYKSNNKMEELNLFLNNIEKISNRKGFNYDFNLDPQVKSNNFDRNMVKKISDQKIIEDNFSKIDNVNYDKLSINNNDYVNSNDNYDINKLENNSKLTKKRPLKLIKSNINTLEKEKGNGSITIVNDNTHKNISNKNLIDDYIDYGLNPDSLENNNINRLNSKFTRSGNENKMNTATLKNFKLKKKKSNAVNDSNSIRIDQYNEVEFMNSSNRIHHEKNNKDINNSVSNSNDLNYYEINKSTVSSFNNDNSIDINEKKDNVTVNSNKNFLENNINQNKNQIFTPINDINEINMSKSKIHELSNTKNQISLTNKKLKLKIPNENPNYSYDSKQKTTKNISETANIQYDEIPINSKYAQKIMTIQSSNKEISKRKISKNKNIDDLLKIKAEYLIDSQEKININHNVDNN